MDVKDLIEGRSRLKIKILDEFDHEIAGLNFMELMLKPALRNRFVKHIAQMLEDTEKARKHFKKQYELGEFNDN